MQLAPPEQFGRYAHRTTVEPTANAQDVWGSERRPKMVVPVFNGTENSEALLYINAYRTSNGSTLTYLGACFNSRYAPRSAEMEN